jgi:hypothetical protein
MLHETLIRQINMEENVGPSYRRMEILLRIFERRMLRIIYGPVNNYFTRITRCTNELFTLCDGLNIFNVIEIGRLRGLVNLFGMQ